MRLIDADALIERIKVYEKNVKSGSRYSDDIYELAHEHIIELVGMQPTAYNVDAVVAELEEKSYDSMHLDMSRPMTETWQIIDLKDAIDIVRNAGKDGAE